MTMIKKTFVNDDDGMTYEVEQIGPRLRHISISVERPELGRWDNVGTLDYIQTVDPKLAAAARIALQGTN